MINRSYHHDQVNSVIATTDHAGAATQTTRYHAFGETISSTGSDPNALKYTGREQDASGPDSRLRIIGYRLLLYRNILFKKGIIRKYQISSVD